MVMLESAEYRKKQQRLLESMRRARAESGAIRLRKKTSNLFRHRQTAPAKWLDLTDFNQVLHIDPTHLVAEVEGLVTYADFVAATLKYHCMPAVVPELKSITVGGAIAGLGAESSSFKFGWVHETALEIEVLLSHGEIVRCSPDNEHRDLFYALPSSYGTLGYVLRARMRLISVKPYVKLSRLRFLDPEPYFTELSRLAAAPAAEIDFIDGVSIGEELFITIGQFVDTVPMVSDYKFMNIYYRSIPNKATDYLTTLDYIWRWDPDWFWCSKYFGMENRFIRFLTGKWLLRSTVYWQIMRFINTHDWIRRFTEFFSAKTETIIQDLQIPAEKSVEFYKFFKYQIHIDPMLICPLKLNPNLDKFLFCPMDKNKIYINFGAYGNFVPSDQEVGYFNRWIENKVRDCHGNKWLYSNVFYSEEDFWKSYDKKYYFLVKDKYDPQHFLKDIYAKCSEKIV